MSTTTPVSSSPAIEPAAPTGDAPSNQPAKLAGKFTDRAALVQGFTELNKHLGLEEYTPEEINTRYKDDASLEKAYKSRESIQGRLKPAKGDKPVAEPKDAGLAISTADPAGEAVEEELTFAGVVTKAGLDPKTLAETYAKDGTLSDEQIAAMRKAEPKMKFWSKDAINGHVAGQAAIEQLRQINEGQAMKTGDEIAGGAEQHKFLRAWARDPANFPPEQLATLNALVTKDTKSYPTMIRLIADAYKQAAGAGKAQPMITGTNGGAGPTSGFASSKEMHTAMAESAAKHGSWESDAALMKRIEATPLSIRRQI